MNLPRFMRRVNRVVTNPLMRTFAWLIPPLAVVHHVGRKSGRPYGTPVVAFPSAAGFVIPMPYGRDVDWARNLVHAHGGEIEQRGRRVALRNPRIVAFGAAETHLPAAVRSLFRAADLPGYVLLDRKGGGAKRPARARSSSAQLGTALEGWTRSRTGGASPFREAPRCKRRQPWWKLTSGRVGAARRTSA